MNSSDHQLDSEILLKIAAMQEKVVAADFDLDQFMNLVVNEIQNLTGATGAAIELCDGDEMVYRSVSGSAEKSLGLRIPVNQSLSGLCTQQSEIIYCSNTETDDRVNKEACRKANVHSMVVTPLFHGGRTIGVLKIMSDKADDFNEEDVKILRLMANCVSTALASQIAQEIRSFF